ncbi:hypothetical protein [Psychrobacillus vulpis]|uniref:Uncharacterized protein n=1 Tax=Psychrobacillus vulpis TaxID=2325572 RepID=A0A544TDM6_9BACI|nr:hypothetical protein [Psychrobacillus vulpis]TQR15499.1 hypothetical protein FG384_19320 [Psychrobacillus vulpis]
MSYINEFQNFLDFYLLMKILELLLVTSCISTIIFLLTKNQYVSYLSSAPILYVISLLQHVSTHFFLLVLAMTVQAIVIVAIQHQRKKKKIQKVQEKTVTN